MSTKETGHSRQMDKALFDFYGKPSFGQVMPLAIQHVLAMIVGCVTPSIIVAGVAGLSQKDSVILIQAALVMSALTTLLQLFPFIKTQVVRHRCRTSGYDGYQFCLRAKYAGNRRRI